MRHRVRAVDRREGAGASSVPWPTSHAPRAQRRACGSAHPTSTISARVAGPLADVRLVHSPGYGGLAPANYERHCADLAAAGIDALNLHHSDWTLGTVTLAHRFELRAFAWDTQETRHILAMLRHGIDGVYCDRVDRMVAAVGEWA